MLDQFPRPAIFAHRGASVYAPENTLAAFELAVRQGADAIEMDAKLTADGEVVLFHDQNLQRTTGYDGMVSNTPWEVVRHLDAGSHFDETFKGEKVPRLGEIFESIGNSTVYNIELTNYAHLTDSLPEKVAAIVKQHRMTSKIFFSSFNPIALIRVRKALPEAPITLLARPGKPGRLARSWVGYLFHYAALHVAVEDCSNQLVKRIQGRGNRIHVYTANQEPDIVRMLKLGVDGIFTDDPLNARSVLQTFLGKWAEKTL